MEYDELIEDAIRRSVADAGQGVELANMLVHWFQEISRGNATLDDLDVTRRHSEIIYDATAGDVRNERVQAASQTSTRIRHVVTSVDAPSG